jgi:hypothetical protein
MQKRKGGKKKGNETSAERSRKFLIIFLKYLSMKKTKRLQPTG